MSAPRPSLNTVKQFCNTVKAMHFHRTYLNGSWKHLEREIKREERTIKLSTDWTSWQDINLFTEFHTLRFTVHSIPRIYTIYNKLNRPKNQTHSFIYQPRINQVQSFKAFWFCSFVQQLSLGLHHTQQLELVTSKYSLMKIENFRSPSLPVFQHGFWSSSNWLCMGICRVGCQCSTKFTAIRN